MSINILPAISPDLKLLILRADAAGRRNAQLFDENAHLKRALRFRVDLMVTIARELAPSRHIAYPPQASRLTLEEDFASR